MAQYKTLQVEFGSDPSAVTIRRGGRSSPIVADVLEVERDAAGEPEKIYLRQKIHPSNDQSVYKGWQPSGAISTILTRTSPL